MDRLGKEEVMAQGKELKRVQGGENLPARRSDMTPFSFMRRMMDDIDQLFGFDTSSEFGLTPLANTGWAPQVEVFEKDGNLVVRADLPGLDRNDVKVNVDDGALTIEGERKTEHEEKREGYFHSERSYGSFARRVPLPRGVDASACDATFENGVLEVTLKLPKQTSRNVQIRGGTQGAGAQGAQQQPRQGEQGQQAQQSPQQTQRAPTQNGPGQQRPH
jgi:HSP20 family protein